MKGLTSTFIQKPDNGIAALAEPLDGSKITLALHIANPDAELYV